jgi:hypothetical protein
MVRLREKGGGALVRRVLDAAVGIDGEGGEDGTESRAWT